jgi:hypothetical protein
MMCSDIYPLSMRYMKKIYSQKLTACLVLALSLTVQTSIVAAQSIMNQPNIVGETSQLSANRQRGFTKATNTNSSSQQNPIFQFSSSGIKYKIKANGLGSRGSGNSKITKFNLKIERSEFIESLSFLDFQDNMLIITSLTDNESGYGAVYSLSKNSSQVKWVANIPGFNIGDVMLEDRYAYITAIGFVSKLDLQSGKYIWKHTGLYKRNRAFGSFDRPKFQGQKVIFKGISPDGDTATNIVVDKVSGKLITIEVLKDKLSY